jgi:hypothetical protein
VTPLSTSLRRTAAVTVVAAACVAGSASTASAASCNPPRYPGSGYFTSLKVTKVSCATGKRVVLAHYRCRVKKGVRGRCASVPRYRYRCSERRRAIASEFNAAVTCRRGSRRVVFTYQQNTT